MLAGEAYRIERAFADTDAKVEKLTAPLWRYMKFEKSGNKYRPYFDQSVDSISSEIEALNSDLDRIEKDATDFANIFGESLIFPTLGEKPVAYKDLNSCNPSIPLALSCFAYGFSQRMVQSLYGNNRGSFGASGFGPSAPVESGKEYDVEIEDISRQGDGIARVEGFVIFVPETSVGDKATILVDRVMRKFAIAHKV